MLIVRRWRRENSPECVPFPAVWERFFLFSRRWRKIYISAPKPARSVTRFPAASKHSLAQVFAVAVAAMFYLSAMRYAASQHRKSEGFSPDPPLREQFFFKTARLVSKQKIDSADS